MTIQEFIDRDIRVIIGDSYPTHAYPKPTDAQPERPLNQMVKYPVEVLLDILNEGVLDIAYNSKLFKKRGYALIGKDTDVIVTPKDFKGLYSMDMKKSSNSNTTCGTLLSELRVIPTHYGLKLNHKVSASDISAYSSRVSGMAVPSEIIDVLYSTGQLTGNIPQTILFDVFKDHILLEYWYLALPSEFKLTDTIDDRQLRYLLKWWTASRAFTLDLHNEANNTYRMYEAFYLRRLETAGETVHNWNYVPISPYTPQY